ncbi:hypothetical protein CYMTET_43602 [Cymbomonas tetramitiformis]|uniref:OTU domain-containing protein n=1 Tax=Cymbomonas tetramitiformis TaxID=36881 RepID=A0AAE0F0D9_9CHLO|nr:hypothetical protein CYMTET_43602 [Cymbomonas tetramitiformis]|eukprot:gene20762-24885_t
MADGDCWLRAICPGIEGMTKHTRSGILYHSGKLRKALETYCLDHHDRFTWEDSAYPTNLGKKKTSSEAEHLLVAAAMAGRVIPCYRIAPPADARQLLNEIPWGNPLNGAPFSMVHFCPPDDIALKNTVPIRVLHLLPGDTYPGHFMRIALSEELRAEEATCAGLVEKEAAREAARLAAPKPKPKPKNSKQAKKAKR